ncbi:hypothetical protein [Marinobacter sp. NFXS9]|uniref:hypothetical protein n=1 Tax=Marinobacter sp. NFXS9 TaxID=2818433 RepID=UPI0032E03CBF
MPAVQAASCKPSTTFWLELTGEKSLDSHQYALVNKEGEGGETIQLAPSSEYKGRRGPILAAEICESKPRSLVLQLEGKETIELTLIPQEQMGPHDLKAPQRNDQDNLMVSVHPTLFCDSGELTQSRPVTGYNESIPGPMRTGWVYVFFNGRLWRELLVQTTEKAAPTFKDTNLSSARSEDGTLQSERLPTGPELDVIHVPAKLLGKTVYDKVFLAFSEVQWSPAYIAELEGSETYLKERCRGATAIKAFLERQPSSLYNDWKIIDDLPPMRARDHALEMDVPQTSEWLISVDGSKVSSARQALIEQRNAIEQDQDVVEADYYIGGPSLYPRWRLLHLNGEDIPDIEAGQDVLGSLRGRHLLTLHLRDPLQAARHLSQQVNASMAFLLAMVNNIKKRPFGITAELFHNSFRRETFPDGSRNPLYIEESWMDSRIDYTDAGRLKRTVYDLERRAVRAFLAESQGAIARLLRDERPENLTSVMRDLFSLEPGDDIAGLLHSDALLQAISLNMDGVDPLRLPQETASSSGEEPQSLALAIATGDHPLGPMMLPHTATSDASRIGDATPAKLRDMAQALEDAGRDMQTFEASILRDMADKQDDAKSPDTTAQVVLTRSTFRTVSPIAGSIANWWLSTITRELKASGNAFKVRAEQIKGAFEGFADAAIPGRTRVQLEGADDGRWYVFLETVDEQGKTLTSGAVAAGSYQFADEGAFKGSIQNNRVGNWLHQSATHPMGFPGILAIFDVWNLVSKFEQFGKKPDLWSATWAFSAFADLIVSSANLISYFPTRYDWQKQFVATLRGNAESFNLIANKINARSGSAEAVARNRLGALGWGAGMFLTCLMMIDTGKLFYNGRRREGFVKLAQTTATAAMVNSDIIAARIVTPVATRVVEHTAVQAVLRSLPGRLALAAEWTGTVTSGWILAVGFGAYMWCESIRYDVMDDPVSEWLRAGPFSGDRGEQSKLYKSEMEAYLGLVKAMTPISFVQIGRQDLKGWLERNKLDAWSDEAAAVLSFASPVFSLTGEPVDIELELTCQQKRVRQNLNDRSRYWHTETLQSEEEQLSTSDTPSQSQPLYKAIEDRYDDTRQAIDFMIGKAQLPGLVARSRDERVETTYKVKQLTLSFNVKVWDRSREAYVDQKVSHTMEDLDIEQG